MIELPAMGDLIEWSYIAGIYLCEVVDRNGFYIFNVKTLEIDVVFNSPFNTRILSKFNECSA